MALDDAVVMAPSLEEAAVMLEAELARKSTRRNRNLPEPSSPDGFEKPSGEGSTLPSPPETTDPGEPPQGTPERSGTSRS
jgi:hypothetical protein